MQLLSPFCTLVCNLDNHHSFFANYKFVGSVRIPLHISTFSPVKLQKRWVKRLTETENNGMSKYPERTSDCQQRIATTANVYAETDFRTRLSWIPVTFRLFFLFLLGEIRCERDKLAKYRETNKKFAFVCLPTFCKHVWTNIRNGKKLVFRRTSRT